MPRDTPLAGATVQLFASNGTTEINVGPDGILGTADDFDRRCDDRRARTYGIVWQRLAFEGEYIVRGDAARRLRVSTVDTAVPADTADPDANADDNDNGVGTSGRRGFEQPGHLDPGNARRWTNNTVTNASGTTYDPDPDFGFTQLLVQPGQPRLVRHR
ncbi:MAG: hypothetical protein MZV64_24375 [Ignavibacteriales bacterium]|nr:hypothetical protein [Ignavibacteriales bacterium]